MNEYRDPLSRGPKGHPPISSQPLPPHPDSSADDTVFRPTFECSQPMFPDASFDLSTNKSTATNSHRRPLQSPHMMPPPLPPNTPSMYSRTSLPPPVPTTVHRSHARWDDPIPPSPMQIIMSRQSTSASQQSGREGSHSRETREPQQHDAYYQSPRVPPYSNNPYQYVSGPDREEREPPPIAQRQFSPGYERQADPYDRPDRDSRARHEPPRSTGYDSHPHELHLRNNSSETHQRCNCENCRRYKQPCDSRFYHDDRERCIHNSSHHQHNNQDLHYAQQCRDDDKHHINHDSSHERNPYGHSSEYGNVHHYYAHEARESAPSHAVQGDLYIQTDKRKYVPDPSPGRYGNYNHDTRGRQLSRSNEQQYRNGYENEHAKRDGFDRRKSRGRSHERVSHAHRYSNGYHDGDDRRTPPPNTPTSPLSLSTFDERPPSRQAWSPKSDNATLHMETSQVPQYVTSSEKHEPDLSRRDHYVKHNNGYHAGRIEHAYHDDRVYFDPRGSHQRGQERGEPVDRQRRELEYYDDRARYQSYDNHRDDRNTHYTNERPNQPVYYNSGNVPTQVSNSSHESQRERRYNDTSPDSRDDYSGSTIPTHSTVNHNRGRNDNQEARPQLRVEIPVSPIVPQNIQQSSFVQGTGNNLNDTYQHRPPNTSRSSGYHPASSAPPRHNQPPITTRSEPMKHPQRPDSRVAIAERERQKSEARHQIMKEIHQATNMRNSAIDEDDRRFWDRQIATLSESFKNL
ncbi:hypothetical protein ACHAW6_004746 [Cyclotella cf. meneghiniana]